MASAGFERKGARRWLVLALFALLSLGWQGLVVQTHVHQDDPGIGWTELGDAGHHLTAPIKAPAQNPVDCPWCRQAAQAGHYLIGGGIAALVAPAAGLVLRAAFPPIWRGRHQPTGWRSRGPPSLS